MKQACAGHDYHVNYLVILPLLPLFILSCVATCLSYTNYSTVKLNFGLLVLFYIRVLGLNDPGRNDPEPGAARPSTWGGMTAFGADVRCID